jgi:predicted aspartyl protease
MGEVRAQVKLTNAGDEGMVRRGLLPPDHVRSCTVDALVDTGFIRSMLPIQVARKLGLSVVGKVRVAGSQEIVEVTEPVIFEIKGRRAVGETLISNAETLVGRTILAQMDLVVDGASNQVIENLMHPDGPVFRV